MLAQECLDVEAPDSNELAWLEDKLFVLQRQLNRLDDIKVDRPPVVSLKELEFLVTAPDKQATMTEMAALTARLLEPLTGEAHIPERYSKALKEEFVPLFSGVFCHELKYNEPFRHIFQTKILANIDLQGTPPNFDTTALMEGMQENLKALAQSTEFSRERFEWFEEQIVALHLTVEDGFGNILNRLVEQHDATRREFGQTRKVILTENQKTRDHQSFESQQSRDQLGEKIESGTRKVLDRLASAQNAVNNAGPIRSSIPGVDGNFVGRIEERAALHKAMLAGDHRFVAIIGPAGHGKTQLTLKFLNDVAPGGLVSGGRPAGILYFRGASGDINLGRIFSDTGQLLGKPNQFQEIYSDSSITVPAKLDFFFRNISEAGHLWLVMDNVETVLDSQSAFVDPDLDLLFEAVMNSGNVTLLINSREMPLFKGSYRNVTVPLDKGLSPDEAMDYVIGEVRQYSQVEQDVDRDLLSRFVRRVHCVPLALDSVIGFLYPKFTTTTLTDLMTDDKVFADFDREDIASGLKHLIKEQFDKETWQSQVVLCALSIFQRSATLEAIEHVLPAHHVRAELDRLVRNKLVDWQKGRYDLLESVREHIHSRVPEVPAGSSLASHEVALADDEVDKVTWPMLHDRAAHYFHSKYAPRNQWKSFEDIQPLLNEIHHRMQAGQYDVAASVLESIDRKYVNRWGYASLVLPFREQLVDKLTRPSDVMINFMHLGVVYLNARSDLKAITCLERAMEIARSRRDRSLIGFCLTNLGNAHQSLGDFGKAIENYENALAIARETGDREEESRLHGNLGNAYSSLGNFDKAMETHEQALAMARETGDRSQESRHLGNLGNAYRSLGNFDKAVKSHEQGLAITREIGDRDKEAKHLGSLGSTYYRLGNFDKAIENYEQSLAIAREIGNRDEESRQLGNLGRCCCMNVADTRS